MSKKEDTGTGTGTKEKVEKKKKDKIVVTIPEITREDTGKLTCTLTVKIVESDYAPKVEDVLKSYQKKAHFKGFRKGKVPLKIIQNMYEEGVKADEIQRAVQAALNKYIGDNKMKILGAPLMKKEDEEKEYNWKKETEFSWRFDIGLQPEISIKVTGKDKFTRHVINVDSELINKYVSDIKKKHGKMSSPETVESEDLVYCQYMQVDEENNPIKDGVKNVAMISIKNVKDKLIFLGLKKSETIWLNPSELTDDLVDLANIFQTTAEKMKALKDLKFAFTVLTINRLQEAQIDQNLFDAVYGVGSVNNEKEFNERVKQDAEKALGRESDDMLTNEVVKYYIKKAKLQFPDDFLKRWLLHSTNSSINEENLEESYERYKNQISWNMVEHRITIDNNIKVTEDDMKEEIKGNVTENAKVRGAEITDKQMEEIIIKTMQDSEQRRNIRTYLHNERFIKFIKDTCKIKEKKVSYDEFYKIAEEMKKA